MKDSVFLYQNFVPSSKKKALKKRLDFDVA